MLNIWKERVVNDKDGDLRIEVLTPDKLINYNWACGDVNNLSIKQRDINYLKSKGVIEVKALCDYYEVKPIICELLVKIDIHSANRFASRCGLRLETVIEPNGEYFFESE